MAQTIKLAGLAGAALLALAAGCASDPPDHSAEMNKQMDAMGKQMEAMDKQVAKMDQQVAKMDNQVNAATGLPAAAAGSNMNTAPVDDAGPAIVPDGFKAVLEAEDMTLSGGMTKTVLTEEKVKTVHVSGADGKASGTIRLEPGIYRARLFEKIGGDNDHDAVTIAIDGKAPVRVFRSDMDLGSVDNPTPRFELTEARDISVVIAAAETDMDLDRVEFERYKLAQ